MNATFWSQPLPAAIKGMQNDLAVGLWNAKINELAHVCQLPTKLCYQTRRPATAAKSIDRTGPQVTAHMAARSMPCQQAEDTRHQLPVPKWDHANSTHRLRSTLCNQQCAYCVHRQIEHRTVWPRPNELIIANLTNCHKIKLSKLALLTIC